MSGDEVVEDVFDHFLTTAGDHGLFFEAEDVGFEFIEGGFAFVDFFADAGVEGAVASFDEVFDGAAFEEAVGDFEAASEGVHAADVGVEEVFWFEAFAADLGVEVEAAGFEAAHFEDLDHDVGGHVDIDGELVGVPADEFVTGIGVDAAEGIGGGGDGEFVLDGVSGEGGVIGFDVELEVLEEPVFAKEVEAGGGVAVVLVGGRLAGFWFDVELAFEADLLFVVDGHVEEGGEVLDFPLHVGIEEGGVAFAAAPERVACAAEAFGDVHGFFDLSGGVGEDVGVRGGGSALAVAWVGEETGGAPEELDAGLFLEFGEVVGDGVESGIAFGEGRHFGGDVAVVEAVEFDAEFAHEFEAGVGDAFGVFDRAAAVVPWADGGACAEGIGEGVFHGVPVGHCEAQVFLHGLLADFFVGIVVAEGEGVFGFGAFERDLADIREMFLTHREVECGCGEGRRQAPNLRRNLEESCLGWGFEI